MPDFQSIKQVLQSISNPHLVESVDLPIFRAIKVFDESHPIVILRPIRIIRNI